MEKTPDPLTQAFVKLYADISVADVRIFDRSSDSFDLTGKEMTYLYSIATIKNCTAKDLVKLFGVSKSMVSQVISKLENKKMILRTPDEEDKRVQFITLSPECLKRFARKTDVISKVVSKVSEKYSEEELAITTKILTEMSTHVIDAGVRMGNARQ